MAGRKPAVSKAQRKLLMTDRECVSRQKISKRSEILMLNPDAILLAEPFDPALVGAAQPMYVHQPDVWVAVYDRDKVSELLYDALRIEEPDEDEDGLATLCAEEFSKIWEFSVGSDRRKHLPIVMYACGD